MINIKQSALEKICIHLIGNQLQEEPLIVSEDEAYLDDDIKSLLKKFFLSSFKDEKLYEFTHESDLDYNEIYGFCKDVFEDPEKLHFKSVQIAKHLYEKSNHFNIKSGELYVTYFDDILIDNVVCDAVGIFKSESKDTYIKVFPEGDNMTVKREEGIDIKKIDKACLVINADEELGYKVMVADLTNPSKEAAVYWMDDFLHVKPKEDHFFHTENMIKLCKGFADDVFNPENKVEKADQVMFLERSKNFFKENETFDKGMFEQQVIADPEIIDVFNGYKEERAESQEVQYYDEFDISKSAIKTYNKVFKSVIKLDKNFTLYVHGRRDLIERGYDEEKQMKYYTLYFDNEQ